jgi:hypothetical protein
MQGDTLLLVDMVEHARHARDRLARLSRAEFDQDVVV